MKSPMRHKAIPVKGKLWKRQRSIWGWRVDNNGALFALGALNRLSSSVHGDQSTQTNAHQPIVRRGMRVNA